MYQDNSACILLWVKYGSACKVLRVFLKRGKWFNYLTSTVIVIGASAGGLSAIADLVSTLDKNLDVAVFVVLHLSRNSNGQVLVQYLQKNTSLNCKIAEDRLPIKKGHIYVAQPDFHLLLKENEMRLTKGPHENRWRPSIDVLFRSAAAYYGVRAIGIILSGMLDDGTSGMLAIKRSGGKCIVQEPEEAQFADMPRNVLSLVDVDYRVPLADMGYIIQDILSKPLPENIPIPEEIMLEAALNERMTATMEDIEKLGVKSNFTCPDCGGGLWEIKEGRFKRYRCYNGHAYTASVLNDKQTEQLEESLWISLRMLEERKHLLLRMANEEQNPNLASGSIKNLERATELEQHIERLKQLLISINKTGPANQGFV